MRFCSECRSILRYKFEDKVMSFICQRCLNEEAARPEDTLIYNDSNTSRQALSAAYSTHARQDNTNLRINRKCSKCDSHIMQQLIVGDQCEVMYVCVQCDNIERRAPEKTK